MKALPIGREDFETILDENLYYVDKTNLIRDILDQGSDAILFTRPRRFGKTLNMSMLRYFFEIPMSKKSRKDLFSGLKIGMAGEEYTLHEEKYPVISLSFKSAKQPDYDMAYKSILQEIAKEYHRHDYVLLSDSLPEEYHRRYSAIANLRAEPVEYAKSIEFLSDCLNRYHGQKTVILLDEYDVPLENAYYQGFYSQMIDFIRSLLESALKTNQNLKLAVITGCLRISKESIFTGLNNLRIISVLDESFGEYFGFTEDEVRDLLSYYDRLESMPVMKDWYDGYRFGQAEVYNPWSVINFVNDLYVNKHAFPRAQWANTSSNQIVRELIERANETQKGEIQSLMDGQRIDKIIREEVTYQDIYDSSENLWNFLLYTGYLTVDRMLFIDNERYASLRIPNTEVMSIYKNQISNWFRDKINKRDLAELYSAMLDGNVTAFEKELGRLLLETISFNDSKEAFYHGFLLGVLTNLSGYRQKSNRESGNGRYDIAVYSEDIMRTPIILELKVADKYHDLNSAAQKGLNQILEKKYYEDFEENGYRQVLCYGIGFYKKQVKIECKIYEFV